MIQLTDRRRSDDYGRGMYRIWVAAALLAIAIALLAFGVAAADGGSALAR